MRTANTKLVFPCYPPKHGEFISTTNQNVTKGFLSKMSETNSPYLPKCVSIKSSTLGGCGAWGSAWWWWQLNPWSLVNGWLMDLGDRVRSFGLVFYFFREIFLSSFVTVIVMAAFWQGLRYFDLELFRRYREFYTFCALRHSILLCRYVPPQVQNP